MDNKNSNNSLAIKNDKCMLSNAQTLIAFVFQVFHVCWGRRRASFLCPIGTIFNQQVLVCDWWYNVDCAATPEHEGVNAGIWEPRVTRNRL